MVEDKKQTKEIEKEPVKVEETKKESPKVEEVKKIDKKKDIEEKPELEREYVIPIRKRILKVPRYKRAKKAIKTIKEFIAKHMKVEDRDLRKVKIDNTLNNEVWFRGIKKPLTKVKVKAKKIAGIVYVELVEIPKVVEFKLKRQAKFKERLASIGAKKPKISKNKEEVKTVEEKVDEVEKEKSGAEAGLKENKAEAKSMKHEATGKHTNKTQPRRQALKK